MTPSFLGADAPEPRHRSGVSLVGQTPFALVFGGCPARGTFFSDLHALHMPTLRWRQLRVHGGKEGGLIDLSYLIYIYGVKISYLA